MSTNGSEAVDADSTRWWRTVLGEYPTGVTLITSLDEEGRAVGMVVGTFSAISQDPPMVGFMPVTTSRTYSAVAAHGTFVASVLGAGHEELCRAFASREEGRFSRGEWITGDDGIPRLADAVAWFAGTITQVVPAGDHSIVLADVDDFGVGNGRAGLPLLFLKGGYGSFQAHSLRFDYQELSERQVLADGMREALEEFARAEGVECMLATVAGDSVVLLASSNYSGDEHVAALRGQSFPFAAPLAPVLAAWAPDPVRKAWTEGARHLLGKVDRPRLAASIAHVRDRGYAVSLGSAIATRFASLVVDPSTNRAEIADLWAAIDADLAQLEDYPDWHGEVSSLQIPVFFEDGTVHMEFVIGLTRGTSRERFEELLERGRALARRLSAWQR